MTVIEGEEAIGARLPVALEDCSVVNVTLPAVDAVFTPSPTAQLPPELAP